MSNLMLWWTEGELVLGAYLREEYGKLIHNFQSDIKAGIEI